MSNTRHVLTWLLALVIVAVWMLLCAGMDERSAMADEHHNRAWVAQQVCGENAHAEWVDDKSIQCYMHTGRKTGAVVGGVE